MTPDRLYANSNEGADDAQPDHHFPGRMRRIKANAANFAPSNSTPSQLLARFEAVVKTSANTAAHSKPKKAIN